MPSRIWNLLSTIFVLVALLLGLSLSCNKSTDPDTNKPPDNGPIGILLSGADSDLALSGTSNHGPFTAPENEWDGDFVTTRLEAVLNSSATVGQVNTALNAVSAKISCMRAGLMFTELVVPAQASVNQAKTVCSTLVASGSFLSAYPCFDPTYGNGSMIFPEFPANGRLTYLENEKFPAAWNLRERVAGLHSPVTVIVADKYAQLTTHPEIPAQTFISGLGLVDTLMDGHGAISGNHGFAVAGVIGAQYDDIGSTGAYADTANLLHMPCFSTAGFGSWVGVITEVFSNLPASGKFILNTSWGYGHSFSVFSKRQRAEHALYWRTLVVHRQGQFLHTQSSGNNGVASPALTNADYNSPFTMAARFDTPLQMLQGTAVTPADSAALTTLFTQLVAHDAATGTKLQNVLTVGSSDWSGGQSTFSNGPADVRMIGETITLPCVMGDATCTPGTDVAWQGRWNGTSFATPQVAALAGWLWSLSQALTVDETIAIIKNCYDGRWVDAYRAVLSLDHSIANAGIRLSLLDIADANGQKGSDMTFDEKDLQMFLDSILYYEADRGTRTPPWPRDHSCFDLNGDGYTGDTMLTRSTAPFDLNINTPPAYSAVQPPYCADTSLNESQLTDRDILYYYAHSDLYTGADSVRDSLLPCGSQVIANGSEYNAYAYVWAERVIAWQPIFRTDTTIDQQQVRDRTTGADPVGANADVSAPCASANLVASASVELNWFVATGSIITGLYARVQCAETDVTPADSNCYAMTADNDADVDGGFEVKGGPIGYSISGSISTSAGASSRSRVVVTGATVPAPLLELRNVDSTGSASGQLPPGKYSFLVMGNGSVTASVTITFSPVAGSSSHAFSKPQR